MPSPEWKTTPATVTSSDFHYAHLRDLDLESKTFGDNSYYVVQFRYSVDRKELFGTIELHEPMAPGEQLTISYDPDDPAQNSTVPRKKSTKYRLSVGMLTGAVAGATLYLMYLWGLLSD